MTAEIVSQASLAKAALIKKLKLGTEEDQEAAKQLLMCQEDDPCYLDCCAVCNAHSPGETESLPPLCDSGVDRNPDQAGIGGEEIPSDLPKSAVNNVRAAKEALRQGVEHYKVAAEHIDTANLLGATQPQIADALGVSQSWVSQILKWYRSGCLGTPFSDQSKQKRLAQKARNNYQATNNASSTSETHTGDATELDSTAMPSTSATILSLPSPFSISGDLPDQANAAGMMPDAELVPDYPAIAIADPAYDRLDMPDSIIRLSEQDQVVADELIKLLLGVSDRVRRYVHEHVYVEYRRQAQHGRDDQ